MPTSCSNWSRGVIRARARWSPPIGRSPNGARCSPTPPASSRWLTASFTTPKSSPSKATPIASRKLMTAPSSARGSGAEPSHERVAAVATWTPEQALAVFELLDEIRDKIWSRYGSRLQGLIQEQQTSSETDDESDFATSADRLDF